MKTQDETPKKHYYWLVAGNVVIASGENDEDVQGIPQNAMITTDEPTIGVFQLGKAQQAMQVTLFQKLGATVKVVDVVIFNLVNLGYMTEEEFNHRPTHVGVRERVPNSNVIDLSSELDRRG